MNETQGKMQVGILGTGKIGTDLLIKIQESRYLRCVMFAGRNEKSEGIQKAKSLGVATSSDSINAFVENVGDIKIVFDATSAEHHRAHAPILKSLGVKVIDLTPARMGPLCIPSINGSLILEEANVNMVTCGGQSSIPIVLALAENIPGVRGVSLRSIVAKNSVGQATLDNIDDYYATTSEAISEFTGIQSVDVKLDVDENPSCEEMINIIRAELPDRAFDSDSLFDAIRNRVEEVCAFAPGYRLVGEPEFNDEGLEIKLAVRGQGHWIPSYAGNLDIINCAALSIAQNYAVHSRTKVAQSFSARIKSMLTGGKAYAETRAELI